MSSIARTAALSGSLWRRKLVRKVALWGCAAIIWIVSARTTRASECAGVSVPDQIAAGGTRLILNGMGLRRATIFAIHIYVGALYLEKPLRSAAAVLSTSVAKRLELHFVRDVDAREMANAIEEGIRKNAGDKAQSARGQVAAVTRRLPPLRKGTDLTFTYTPNEGLDIFVDRRLLGRYRDAQFAQLFFSIWFGREPPDPELKAGMLGAKCK